MRLSDICDQMMLFFKELADASLEEQFVRPVAVRSQRMTVNQELHGASSQEKHAYENHHRRSDYNKL